jgi:hypothetical protein
MSEAKKSSRPKRQRKEPQPTKTALRIARAQVAVPHTGLTFSHKHQIFIGRLKRGEIWALNELGDQAKIAVTPLLEVSPPGPATKTKAAKSLPQHIDDLMQPLATEWTGLPCYLDTQYLQDMNGPSTAAAQIVFEAARARNVVAVPVSSPYFSQHFQEAIRDIIAVDKRGAILRLPSAFFNETQKIAGYLNGLVSFLGIGKDQVDVLIDLRYLPNLVAVQQSGAYCFNNLPFIDEWRTVTLASGCFPDSISKQPLDKWIQFSRTDWDGWVGIAQQRAAAKVRIPSYGDYGVRCGGVPQDVRNTPAPNIRYSDPRNIWVRRAKKQPGAMHSICKELVRQPYFRGAPFSPGDASIAQRAAKTNPKNGSPEQWIQWCTNHHLELTASQIQNLPLP